MADTTTELEVLDQIVDVLGGQSGQYETVVPVLRQIKELLAAGITDPEAIAAAVAAWLDEHPEATTTVQDGSITDTKLVQTGGVLSSVAALKKGEVLIAPLTTLQDVVYATDGHVWSNYLNYVTLVFELEPDTQYKITEQNVGYCVYGLSDTMYSGESFRVESYHDDQASNTDTFTNSQYKYLYVTQSSGGVDRGIELAIVHNLLGVQDKKTISAAQRHLYDVADAYPAATNEYIDSVTGTTYINTSFRTTDFLDVSAYKKIVLLMPVLTSANTRAGVCFYDSSKQYMSGVMAHVDASGGSEVRIIDVPSGVTYMRTCYRASEAESFFVRADDVYVNAKEIENLSDAVHATSFGVQMFKRIGVIGDSISVGWAKDRNGQNSRRNTDISWPQQMARRIGCTAYNLGASGVDPIEWFQSDYEFAQYCYTQYQSVGECDLYIIALGLNQATLGSISDINQTDYEQNAATYYGQYARIIQMINHDHPNAKVMCFTEPTPNIASYDVAVRNICALSYIDAELVDLDADYSDLFTTPEIVAQKQPDGLHYTPYGYSLLADATMQAMNDYISKNPDGFKYVGVAAV